MLLILNPHSKTKSTQNQLFRIKHATNHQNSCQANAILDNKRLT